MPMHRVYLQSRKVLTLNNETGQHEKLIESPEQYLEADPDQLEELYGREKDESDRELILRLQDKPEVQLGDVLGPV